MVQPFFGQIVGFWAWFAIRHGAGGFYISSEIGLAQAAAELRPLLEVRGPMGTVDRVIVQVLVGVAVFGLGVGSFVGEMWVARTALWRANARRCRAFVRLFVRRRFSPSRSWLALVDANGLFWAGAFDEALARTEWLSTSGPLSLRRHAVALSIACLILGEREANARHLFEESKATLRQSRRFDLPVPTAELLAGLLCFYEGNLDEGSARLESVIRNDPLSQNPFSQLARFHFGAIAHRRGDLEEARNQLTELVKRGGNSFIATWASSTYEEVFGRRPQLSATPRRYRRGDGGVKGLALCLRIGMDLALLRGDSLRRVSFTPEQVVLLMWVDLGAILLGQWTQHSPGTEINTRSALAQLMPLLLVPPVGYLALSVLRARTVFLRLAGGFCGALPSLIALWFLAANLKRIGATRFSFPLEIITGFWALSVALVIIARLSPGAGSLRRWATCMIFLLPWGWAAKHGARETVWRFVAPLSSYHDHARRLPDLVFAQADLTRENVAALRDGRPGIDDLYFVGLAGWGQQDVFGNEVRFAQRLFDARFDTRGRSLVLINDASAHDAVPMATEQTLARALISVGEHMDRDEDVLFLFLTSHGSKKGVAIDVPDAPELHDDLSPVDLRSLLDEARIKWRVLMVSACESGVFVGPLQNPFTLIATAAGADRSSFGCTNGADFTEFGRAVLKEQLAEQRSFESAFRKAADVIAEREKERHLEASLPQLFVGEAIAAKLSALEARLEKGSFRR